MTGGWLPVAALLIATPALAGPAIDLPAGPLGRSVEALARQSNISVAIADGVAWAAPVKAVRGRLTPVAALKRIVAGTGARVVAIDKVTFRIEPALRSKPVARSMPPLPVAAVEDDPPIIVTASKRDTRFGDYQGIVQRIDGDALGFGGEMGTDGLISRLGSLSSTHLGAGRNKLFIRGVADSSFTGPTQATVGQYLGDIRLTYNAPDPDLRLYDIAAVEVLEGPQATLYGAGSLGGIVRIVRNPPRLGAAEAAVSAGVSLTQHGDPGLDVGGSVNLPVLDDRIALRAVAYGITEGGYIDDPGRGRDDVNRTRIAGGRAVLRFDAGNDWTVDLGATLQHIRGEDSQFADRDAPPLTHRSAFAQGFTADYRLAELVVGKDWDGLRLLSSTGVARQRLSERYDAGSGRVFTQDNRTLLISNETRLWRPMDDRFGWVAGASLVHNRAEQARALGPVDAPVPSTGVTNRILETTAFGEASLMPIAGLTLTAGGRLTHARLSGDGEDAAPAFSAAAAAARARIVADRSETRFLPSVAASASVLPGTILFVRYNQGFRPGGLSVDNDFVQRFRSDRVATLESGVRYGQPGRDSLDLAASAAWTRWSDIQADFIDGAGLPATSNIGDGRIYSLAVNAGWRPTREFSFDAAMVFNDSRVTDPSTAAQTRPAIPLRRIPNVARWTGRLGAEYRTDLDGDLELRVGASARYTGRSRLGVGPMLGDAQGDYLDTSLTARVGRDRMGVTLSLTNLADSIGNRFALGTPFALDREQITPLRPRTVRLGVDARF
ncbi:TonB-dependent receptor [Glacieibacterium frigidum]|uniref:TonB-dependent receptor n=1 Tax=Glacieibacterium frigidum TaxID=2593303 RepID=A0A552UG75_9SPHN|nr:TonB-dependent receptor [Glacieibacterium frigidum]TRW17226.1 TonB-dependent receptor [Glacieibacterium frigidum]